MNYVPPVVLRPLRQPKPHFTGLFVKPAASKPTIVYCVPSRHLTCSQPAARYTLAPTKHARPQTPFTACCPFAISGSCRLHPTQLKQGKEEAQNNTQQEKMPRVPSDGVAPLVARANYLYCCPVPDTDPCILLLGPGSRGFFFRFFVNEQPTRDTTSWPLLLA